MDNQITSLLREIKEATGWTESHIAVQIGTSQPTVSRILNGQSDCKSATYRAISALYARYVPGATKESVGAEVRPSQQVA